MKRLIWLILVLNTLAFAQVRPVVVFEEPAEACDCCESTDGCDMPDCAPPTAQVVVSVDRPAMELRSESRQTAKKTVPTPAKFYSAYAEIAPRSAGLLATAEPLPAAKVPLFAVHCRFLI